MPKITSEQFEDHTFETTRKMVEYWLENESNPAEALGAALGEAVAVLVDLCKYNNVHPSEVQDLLEKRYELIYAGMGMPQKAAPKVDLNEVKKEDKGKIQVEESKRNVKVGTILN